MSLQSAVEGYEVQLCYLQYHGQYELIAENDDGVLAQKYLHFVALFTAPPYLF